MGLFDKAKEMAQQAAGMAQDAAMQKVDDMRQSAIEKQERKSEQRDLTSQFKETKRFGELSIDSGNHLLKIRHATAKIQKKGSVAGKATLAMMTGGLSLAAETVMKPHDVVVPFSMVRGYSVVQDDDVIQGGTLGAAAVGGILLGGVGAMIGAAGGKRKMKKSVNTMALRIDLNDLDMPCVMVTYIGRPTKTTSGEYKRAVQEMQEAMSCIDLIASLD